MGQSIGWNSSHQILFPELQNSDSTNGDLFLLLNIHDDPTKGKPLDEVLDCASQQKTLQQVDMGCAVVTQVMPWNGASYHLIQPISPANDPLEVGFRAAVLLCSYARHVKLDGTTISGVSSRTNELILYPTKEFFDIFFTHNPFVVMVGAVLIVFVKSRTFLVYDRSVRREFTAKSQLLQSK